MSLHVPEASRVLDGPMGTEPGWDLALICDDGTYGDPVECLGWEHVSVRAFRGNRSRVPTWREMAFVKETCWDPEDLVVQYHPPRSEYVNTHPHVLHLWRNTREAFPYPARILV
jgi:hypothetical protein